MKKRIPIISGLAGVLAACVLIGVLAATRVTEQAVAEPTGLDGTAWTLVSWTHAADLPVVPITMQFEDGSLHGSSGCNNYFGPVTLDDTGFTTGPMATTMMYCPDTAEAEDTYLGLLETVDGWNMDGDHLVLTTGAAETLRFAAA
jgi:heat shock protein HslJ